MRVRWRARSDSAPPRATPWNATGGFGDLRCCRRSRRYTGVLYDALGEDTLSPAAREFAREHVLIHSALFGLVRAGDPIPRYRLAHDSRLPGAYAGKALARSPISAALADRPGLTLDLRSEAYVALGPAPDRARSSSGWSPRDQTGAAGR